jgi:PAS domain S-box-containing protein
MTMRRLEPAAIMAMLGLVAYAVTGRVGVLIAAVGAIVVSWGVGNVARRFAGQGKAQGAKGDAHAARYRTLVDLAPDAIATIAANGCFTSLNPAFEYLTGWECHEWLGRPFEETLHPEDAPVAREVLARLLRDGGTAPPFEARFLTKTDDQIVGEVHAAAEVSDGAVTGVICITRDITDRKRAEMVLRAQEERLRKSEEKFVRAFQANGNPMLITRLADGVVVEANDAFLAATGYMRDEVVGRSTRELVWPTPADRDQIIQGLQNDGHVRDLEVKARAKDGMLLDWLLSMEVIELEGTAHTIGAATDVTARKRVEEALRKSEERFEKAFRLSPSIMLITRLRDGMIVDVNEAWSAATGYSRAEAVGRTTVDLVWQSPEERGVVVEQLRTKGRIVAREARTRTKSGAIRASILSGELVTLDGEPHVLVGSEDITEKNRVAAALRESEERFRELIEELGVGIAVLDRELRVVLANRSALKMLGVTSDQLLGHVPHAAPFESINEDGSVMTPEMQPSRIAMATKRPVRHVVMARRKVGQTDWVWYLVDAVPQLDQHGEVRRTIITFHDITERRRAEEGQRELHEALRVAASEWTMTFDAFEAPALILGANGAIRRLNRAARDLAGRVSYAALTHRSIGEIGAGEPWRTMATLAGKVRETGESARAQVQEADPLHAWYVTATPVSGGQERRTVVVARDISDFVELQESLRRTETTSALGAVVVGVAHEVRNPLFAISATVDAFEARFASQQGHGRYFKALRQEVSRLSELMGALLEYGRPPTLEIAEHRLEDVLQRAVQHCEPLATTRQVQVTVDVPERLPGMRVDATRMLQVFQNLVENAIQHSARGGAVAVRAGAVRDRATTWVEVSVADQGPGFREEDLPHLFQPFFTRRHGGTGLGLSIVQRIVEQHAGQVRAGNGRDGGAVMTVRLKVAETSPGARPELDVVDVARRDPSL